MTIIVSSRQLILSLSSRLTRPLKNSSIVLLLEFDQSKEKYTQPVLSYAKIIVIRGQTQTCLTELGSPLTYHLIFLKSDIPSQVSSIFMMYFLDLIDVMSFIANCYLRTRFFGLFACREVDLIRLYDMLKYFLKADLISYRVYPWSLTQFNLSQTLEHDYMNSSFLMALSKQS